MRNLALLALAVGCVFAAASTCLAQSSTLGSAPPRSTSVAKQAPPQMLAPPQVPSPTTPSAAAPPPSPSAVAPQPAPMPQPAALAPQPAAPSFAFPAVDGPDDTAQRQPQPPGGFGTPEQLMDWVSNYRKHRNPSRVPAAVKAMNTYGLFGDEEKAWFCTGFIAGVLGSNPKDGASLVGRMLPLPDKEQGVIIRAIVYSGRPDWRELLEKFSPRMPLRRPLIDDFLSGKRPTLMDLQLDHGGSPGIYALWGYYVATGQHEPVVRIMDALRWSKKKSDSAFSFRKIFSGWGHDPSAFDKITAGGTAKWTLASYAERDRELIKLYRAEYGRQPEEISLPLKDVIEAAEIFESETIRKDQFGAIEDAQRRQLTNEAGMTKGATAGSIAIATGCVAATALGQAYIAVPCVLGGALYTGAVKLAQ